jgi:hypothetical protein
MQQYEYHYDITYWPQEILLSLFKNLELDSIGNLRLDKIDLNINSAYEL